jgi:hypothetical protein
MNTIAPACSAVTPDVSRRPLIRNLEGNASCLSRHPEIMTREWGLNMRGEGRAAGAEGRAKIQENRKRQAEEERRAKIRALSSVATGKKVRTG